jgi:hypothetical protein
MSVLGSLCQLSACDNLSLGCGAVTACADFEQFRSLPHPILAGTEFNLVDIIVDGQKEPL